ncbi:MAG: excinuclease ABC subunit C [Epsilonproteobacteria bacterium]|nr:excinuclease ABC subunit C [Campylobacterota bacterium]
MSTLERTLAHLPGLPGVYRFYDAAGKLLYVGKAKNLAKRVRSYFRFDPFKPAANLPPRIAKMVQETKHIDYVVLANEQEALLLENQLIKGLGPKYNILLRDDKTYPYIWIDLEDPFPTPKITRRLQPHKRARYFGPFPTGAKELLQALYRLFPLVQRSNCLQERRACLFFQMGRCLAPCEGRIDQEEYRRILEEALKLLSDKSSLLKRLRQEMEDLAQGLHFEEAAKVRDWIAKIEGIQIQSPIDLEALEEFDLFMVLTHNQQGVALRLVVRGGKLIAIDHHLFPLQEDLEAIYRHLILATYESGHPPPGRILLPFQLEDRQALEELLAQRFQKSLSITPPTFHHQGLVELARQKGRELLNGHNPHEELLFQLQDHFGLTHLPQRIVVFDVSHLQGSAPVGAALLYEGGAFRIYRHYTLSGKSEVEQMGELLERYGARGEPGDLWLIDGGEQAYHLAFEITRRIGIEPDILAIAKERQGGRVRRARGGAWDRIYGAQGSFSLERKDPKLLLLQYLRDEAHRFALARHRRKRHKESMQIELLQIPGIGKVKLRRLLDYFGTFEAIAEASLEELESILSPQDAKAVWNHYRFKEL